MVDEILEWMRPRDGSVHVDGTLGGGSHSAAILEASSPRGRLWGFDRDGEAIEAARARLDSSAGRWELVRAEFGSMDSYVPLGTAWAVLLDLGVSSHQLDTAERGFGHGVDGPLDMRMSQEGGMTAADVVNGWEAEALARVFWEYADERDSRRIARALVRERESRPFVTTRQLAEAIARVCPRAGRRVHPATRCFQALRMVVNDELGGLDRGLRAAMRVLEPGGRLCVISFESVTDRRVKQFFREAAREYVVEGDVDRPEFRRPCEPGARILTRRPVVPSEVEVERNPRARSAQLRVLEKLDHEKK